VIREETFGDAEAKRNRLTPVTDKSTGTEAGFSPAVGVGPLSQLGPALRASSLLGLQRTAGNAAVTSLVNRNQRPKATLQREPPRTAYDANRDPAATGKADTHVDETVGSWTTSPTASTPGGSPTLR
jgi:hypothetical protein